MSESTSNISASERDRSDDDGRTLVMDDAVLLRQCRAGDMGGFAVLVRKYQDRLYNAILRMCGHRDDAEELCQEAFVKALESLATFRQDAGFYTWLFRIGMNLAISRRRRVGRVKFHSLDPVVPDGQTPHRLGELMSDDRQIDPSEQAAKSDIERKVMDSLAGLDDEFRAVVVLRDIEDMDYSRISRVLGVPVGTVKSRLYRARCMLRERLQDLVR